MTDQATRDAISSEADERAAAEGHYFDPRAALHVDEFLRVYCRHSKGQWAGQPFELLDWQWADVVAPLFGWKRADGSRRYRRAYVEIPKKNGKSALLSGLGLYLLTADGEPGAEVYSAAADRNQAGIIYGEAANMVEASPALAAKLDVRRSTKRINYPANRSWFQALSAEAYTKEGLNIHALLFDELHAQPTRELWDALEYGGAARRQPLIIAITTAGYDRSSICWEQHEYAQAVIEGRTYDPAYFGYIRAADDDDDWTDPEVWAKANPSLGVTITLDGLAEDCRRAQESPSKQNAFRRYRLNQWTQQDVRWLQMDRWDACAEVDFSDLEGRPCFGGLDLASTVDLAAFVLVFPPEDEGEPWACLPWFWAPEDCVDRRERQNRVRYRPWVQQGHIKLTSGEVIDFDRIRADVNALGGVYEIRQIAIDPWNATQLATQLEGDGFELRKFVQGFRSFTGPTRHVESLVISGKLAHGANPVLRWMAGNVAVSMDAAGNLKPAKDKSSEKIDGIVALIMGVGAAIAAGEDGPSVYEDRGIISI